MLRSGSKKGFLLVKIDFAFLPTTFIVCCVLVHCRVGSLEITRSAGNVFLVVHCRVGSLEMRTGAFKGILCVHCRVGSLEKNRPNT